MSESVFGTSAVPSTSVLPDLAGISRPLLRSAVPLLWRTSSSIQIGSDVILTNVSRAHVAWMTSLDGMSSPEVIVDSLTIPEADARRMVRALLAAGALDDAAQVPATVRWADSSARDLAAVHHSVTHATYRDVETAHASSRRRHQCRVGIVGSGAIAHEVRQALTSAGLTMDDDHPTITILADAPHPDVPAQFDHPAMGGAHLHVASFAEQAVVGPLVVPGRTSCLRCRHLHRQDADSAWPVLAVQWSHAIAHLPLPPVDPLLSRLAADWAVLVLRTWVDLPDAPHQWGDMAIDLTLPLGDPQIRSCPPHPLCGCRWNAGPDEEHETWRSGAAT